jgi:hypothetical protein
MANRWGIPKEVEVFVKKRDLECVYCGVRFTDAIISHKSKRTWEHIINDIRINNSENIALCCASCNARKGAKKLEDWLNSNYCKKKGINYNNVSHVVKMHIEKLTKQ